jgi:hypothetical protein
VSVFRDKFLQGNSPSVAKTEKYFKKIECNSRINFRDSKAQNVDLILQNSFHHNFFLHCIHNGIQFLFTNGIFTSCYATQACALETK